MLPVVDKNDENQENQPSVELHVSFQRMQFDWVVAFGDASEWPRRKQVEAVAASLTS
jgi:hypothetical protein